MTDKSKITSGKTTTTNAPLGGTHQQQNTRRPDAGGIQQKTPAGGATTATGTGTGAGTGRENLGNANKWDSSKGKDRK